VVVGDLALGDLFEGDRQVVLRAGLDQRRGELVERALAKLVVVVVDLPGALRADDHQCVARVDPLHQLVDAGVDDGPDGSGRPGKARTSFRTASTSAATASG